MSEQNKEIVRRVVNEIFNQRKHHLIDELYAPGCWAQDPANDREIQHLGDLGEILKIYDQAFPDYQYSIDDLFCEEDKVALRFSVRGTHTGEFLGYGPTGRSFVISGLAICEISEGRIARVWQHWDNLGLLEQLGINQETLKPLSS